MKPSIYFLACILCILVYACDRNSSRITKVVDVETPIFVPTTISWESKADKLADFLDFLEVSEDGAESSSFSYRGNGFSLPQAVLLDLRQNRVRSYETNPIISEGPCPEGIDRILFDKTVRLYGKWIAEHKIKSRFEFLHHIGFGALTGFFHVPVRNFKYHDGMEYAIYNTECAIAFWGDALPAGKRMSAFYLPPPKYTFDQIRKINLRPTGILILFYDGEWP